MGVDGLKEISDLCRRQAGVPYLPIIVNHCKDFIEMGISNNGTERRYELVKPGLRTAKTAGISVARKRVRP